MADKFIVKNRKAWHDYEVLERFEAGIALVGTEVKSLRAGHVKLVDSFCQITGDYQLNLHQMEISPYKFGNIHNHKTDRVRRLLMHKREIVKLLSKVKEKGLTLIPLSLYYKGGKVKVEIAVCRGKKLYDKRSSLKAKDDKLDMNRALKHLNQ
ncbi:SsrA-binding protein SmpB [bacterium]|nr:SsrA-binding protein SmpB [bacterium]